MELYKKFRELRREKGWSQEYVADQIFVSKKTISSWETGHRGMDADAIESLSKLYGYELLPEEKKETNIVFANIRDIVNSPTLSLSARDMLAQQKVTLRADISQKLKRAVRDIAESSNCSIDEVVEKALSHYVWQLKEKDALPKEDGMFHIESSYYEREMMFDKREANLLLAIYQEVGSKQGFKTEANTVQEMVKDRSSLDTVLYHVEEFGKDHEQYESIQHIFEEESGNRMKLHKKINKWVIKEKPLVQVPFQYEDTRRFVIFSPDGRCMEDNLTVEEAEEWATENRDYIE